MAEERDDGSRTTVRAGGGINDLGITIGERVLPWTEQIAGLPFTAHDPRVHDYELTLLCDCCPAESDADHDRPATSSSGSSASGFAAARSSS